MTKYKNLFRVESARLKNWDYSIPWWYYVTINTKNHINYFGQIRNGKMESNELGKIAEQEWLKTKTLRDNIDLDYYVIMPNHIHGIIILKAVETRCSESLHYDNTPKFSKPIKNSLSVIINQYKGSVKRWANKNNSKEFSWQPRFYDHIIRNEKELYQIRKYIEQNPLKWDIGNNTKENIYY